MVIVDQRGGLRAVLLYGRDAASASFRILPRLPSSAAWLREEGPPGRHTTLTVCPGSIRGCRDRVKLAVRLPAYWSTASSSAQPLHDNVPEPESVRGAYTPRDYLDGSKCLDGLIHSSGIQLLGKSTASTA
jgi:hypothetical protein